MNYYGRFNKSRLYRLLQRINTYIVRWARNKYRRLGSFKKAKRWWLGLVDREPGLFAHWAGLIGFSDAETAGQPTVRWLKITSWSRWARRRLETDEAPVDQGIVEIVLSAGASLSVQSAMPAVVSAIGALACEGADGQGGDRPRQMREVYASITDPRDRRGRRHSVASILLLVQCAVLAGATTWAAIRHWINAAPQHVLADCGVRLDRRTGRYRAPHPSTMSDLLGRLDLAQVDLAYARHRTAQLAELHDRETETSELFGLAVDGKASRGTARGDKRALHRLGAFTHQDAIMVATCDVDGKSNEINAFAPLLDQIGDLTNAVISGDAMHCQRKHAAYLHKRGAHYVFPVAGNQPGLFDQIDALPWTQTPIGWLTYDRGHGRQEIRTIQVLPAPSNIRFAHAHQVFLIERHVHDLNGKHLSSIAVLGITDLTAKQAEPAQILEFNRGQWAIENRDHYVRDVTLGEDRCRVRTASRPSILATMRSYAISALRLLGFTNIAQATRWARDDFTHPLITLNLTMSEPDQPWLSGPGYPCSEGSDEKSRVTGDC
jgi:predicted transposase YbfD/YdcC